MRKNKARQIHLPKMKTQNTPVANPEPAPTPVESGVQDPNEAAQQEAVKQGMEFMQKTNEMLTKESELKNQRHAAFYQVVTQAAAQFKCKIVPVVNIVGDKISYSLTIQDADQNK